MSQKMFGEKWNSMMVVVLVFLGLLLHSHTAHATTYTVGDSSGWVFNVAGWENGKNFKAADVLVFNYSPAHNVVVVDKASYESCSVPANAKTYSSGHDQITLAKGPNYFICGKPGHCQSGMKIAAIAS